ncbi:hypothetical protein ACOME3_008294 [Neoechinorhynchus agilis]
MLLLVETKTFFYEANPNKSKFYDNCTLTKNLASHGAGFQQLAFHKSPAMSSGPAAFSDFIAFMARVTLSVLISFMGPRASRRQGIRGWGNSSVDAI